MKRFCSHLISFEDECLHCEIAWHEDSVMLYTEQLRKSNRRLAIAKAKLKAEGGYMENQHQKIKGYRDLTQEEIDLMNEVKEMGIALQTLINKVNAFNELETDENGNDVQPQVQASEARRWSSIARTDFQTGCMALTRAVAKPGFF